MFGGDESDGLFDRLTLELSLDKEETDNDLYIEDDVGSGSSPRDETPTTEAPSPVDIDWEIDDIEPWGDIPEPTDTEINNTAYEEPQEKMPQTDIDSLEDLTDHLTSEAPATSPTYDRAKKEAKKGHWQHDSLQSTLREYPSHEISISPNKHASVHKGNASTLEIADRFDTLNTEISLEPSENASPRNEYVHGAIFMAAQKISQYDAQTEGEGIQVNTLSPEEAEEAIQAYTLLDHVLEDEQSPPALYLESHSYDTDISFEELDADSDIYQLE